MVGRDIGPYQIIAKLGEGGMGEVYRALDTSLKREVALKVLPSSRSLDPDRVRRFAREAEMLAALNHPNIAAIYGLEEQEGSRALVMELVEGESLAERIARGPIPIDEALPIARQIAEALAGAHEQGIVHRDLKPANVMVRHDGVVKVLDFGLAKLERGHGGAAEAGHYVGPAEAGHYVQHAGSDLTGSPTVLSPALLTDAGVVLGTAAYMSPEQAKGQPADKRSDIWAFGCVLYETLTGRPAFAAATVAETLAAVLRGEPDWQALPSPVPPAVRALLRACLVRDRHQRVADLAAALFVLRSPDLADAPVGPQAPGPSPTPHRVRNAILVSALALAAASAAGGGVWLAMRGTADPVKRLIVVPTHVSPVDVGSHRLAITPSGSHLVYVDFRDGGPALYVRPIDRFESTLLANPATQPFLSPAGEWVGFFDPVDQMLKRVRISGGPVIPIAAVEAAFRGGTWVNEDTIVFASDQESGLVQVSVGTGQVEVITRVSANAAAAEGAHVLPRALTGRPVVLFSIVPRGGPGAGPARIAAVDLRTRNVTPVLGPGSHATYLPRGYLVYTASNSLWAVRFDPDRLTTVGSAMPVLEGVAIFVRGLVADYAVANDGTLAYTAASNQGPALARAPVWVDRSGRQTSIAGTGSREYSYPRISPDGTRVAFDIREGRNDIWVLALASNVLSRFTAGAGQDRTPLWVGDRLAFGSRGDGTRSSVFWAQGNRSGSPQQLTANPAENQYPIAVSRDGKQLVVWEVGGSEETSDLLLLDLPASDTAAPAGRDRLRPLVKDEFGAMNASISPDGWLAYESNESGSWEVHVRRFPDGPVQQVSSGGGRQPLFSPRGDELFYLASGWLVSVRVRPGPVWAAGPPEMLFSTDGYYLGEPARNVRQYDVDGDAKRFLMLRTANGGARAFPQTSILMVQNWLEDVRRVLGE